MEELFRVLDRQMILGGLFHPRRTEQRAPAGAFDFSIPVAGATIGARWHRADPARPSLLFFHGNGETVPDYDDLAALFAEVGLNLFVVDYRGYGWSTGSPSVGTLIADAEAIHVFFQAELSRRGHKKRPFLMGRSLGSGPASHLATGHPEAYAGLILESGFADVVPLLQRLGIRTPGLEEEVRDFLSNDRKLARLQIPVLFLHGAQDQLIPASHSQDNFRAVPHERKLQEIIEGAGHNNLLAFPERYFAAMERLQTLSAK